MALAVGRGGFSDSSVKLLVMAMRAAWVVEYDKFVFGASRRYLDDATLADDSLFADPMPETFDTDIRAMVKARVPLIEIVSVVLDTADVLGSDAYFADEEIDTPYGTARLDQVWATCVAGAIRGQTVST